MKDIPIIFSGPMVRALLEGGKTMTRRLLRPRPTEAKPTHFVKVGTDVKTGRAVWEAHDNRGPVNAFRAGKHCVTCHLHTPKPTDRLWVRENWYSVDAHDGTHDGYAADLDPAHQPPRLIPCIHMPRHLSRLTLVVSAVKVERLNDLSHADALAEGIARQPQGFGDGWVLSQFADLWDSLHGAGAWDANPFVVALSFTVHKANIDAMPKAEAA